LRDVAELLVAGDRDGLDEELIAASRIGWGLGLHRLQENCELLVARKGVGANNPNPYIRNLPETSTS